MDHEKPEVVMPQLYEYASENTRSTLSPDFDFALEPPVEEPPNVEDRRERRGESLWYVASEMRLEIQLTVHKESVKREAH
jgi:amino acid transporter